MVFFRGIHWGAERRVPQPGEIDDYTHSVTALPILLDRLVNTLFQRG